MLLRDTDGSALVESAVLLPMLFVLLFGVYEFSWFFYQQHVASIGIRDAARYLARVKEPCNEGSASWPLEQAVAKNLDHRFHSRSDSARQWLDARNGGVAVRSHWQSGGLDGFRCLSRRRDDLRDHGVEPIRGSVLGLFRISASESSLLKSFTDLWSMLTLT